MKIIDLKLQKLFKNKKTGWVAVSANFKNVIASSLKLSDLVKKTKDKREKVYYLPVNKKISGFIGKG